MLAIYIKGFLVSIFDIFPLFKANRKTKAQEEIVQNTVEAHQLLVRINGFLADGLATVKVTIAN